MPSYLVLARKYRPAVFSDVIGQDHVVQTLCNSILSGRVAHAFLFCGVRGVGKTTVARILAKALNCLGRSKEDANPCNKCSSCNEISKGISVDVQEIDGASNTSVDNIREINENIKYPPVSSPYKIIIIDEVHMISINAFNALLKTLEEPPSHAKFIFATTESHKVPATINSRCQRHNFRTISKRDIVAGMARILEKEDVEASEEALSLVAREAQGSFRDALSLLDQVIAFGSERVTANDVTEILGISGHDSLGRLVKCILNREGPNALALLHLLFQQGYDPQQFVLDLIQYVRNLVVIRTVAAESLVEGMIDAAQADLSEMEEVAGLSSPEHLQNIFSMLLRSEADVRRSSAPWIALEVAVLRMIHAPDIVYLSELIRRIDSAKPAVTRKLPGGTFAGEEVRVVGAQAARGTVDQVTQTGPAGAKPIRTAEPPTERFTITKVTPVPVGTPDEVWTDLKERVNRSGLDPFLLSMMDHGSLISFGPTQVEIGFNKAFYKREFESRLLNKNELRSIFEEFFGEAAIKVLTLAGQTSLDAPKFYVSQTDGQTDLDRALKNEAMEHQITKAILTEFEDGTIEDIKIITAKT
ncbi:MAG: DNA polymerase III subunit gamma/tau [Deltaproteobacteria bacterium]|nr:DNA polymerase III subunit gamma/tau [Deltaproteobacteria bacterium]